MHMRCVDDTVGIGNDRQHSGLGHPDEAESELSAPKMEGSWKVDQIKMLSGVGSDRIPRLNFVAGAGFKTATSGRDRARRSGLEDRGSPGVHAERPHGPLRSLAVERGLRRTVSGRFLAAVRIGPVTGRDPLTEYEGSRPPPPGRRRNACGASVLPAQNDAALGRAEPLLAAQVTVRST
jgi:hypothetical protein